MTDPRDKLTVGGPGQPYPRNCTHVLQYDTTHAITYCERCGWWWDANFESPPAKGHTRVCLNPDNEPTSEHMQWSEDKCSDQ